MPKNKVKEPLNEKVISYTMQPDVRESLEEIMKIEGHATMHKAINACILQRKTMREAISETQDECTRLIQELYDSKLMVKEFIKSLRLLDKHTKTS